ncbi:hypothetical protein BH24ACI5_BH24ACI5_23370 [soil metagenome]
MSIHGADEGAPRPLGRVPLITGGLALFAAGAVVSALLIGRGAGHEERPAEVTPSGSFPPSSAASAPATGPLPDVTVPVSADVAARAGIELAAAQTRVVAARLRLPGTVQPDEYRQVVVTPFVSGRITGVSVQLGDRVQRGAPLARIYSSDLAEAQAKFASMRAELIAAEQRLARTTRLVEIGAASRQELEADEAMRARLAAEVQGAGARLRELGLPPERVAATATPSAASATVTVPAPVTGVVTVRKANIGLVVDPGSELFTVASLSPVWVIADVQEADLSKVRVGAAATVVADAFPDRQITGKVSYISPDLRPQTRTAQVRVEVPNPGDDLRFGMFVNVELVTPQASAVVTVPANAVQTIGARTFVYLAPADRPGEYIEREVTVGTREGDVVEIVSGVSAADQVVTKGSFMVRAERERLGLRPPGPSGLSSAAAREEAARVVKVLVNESGFEPSHVPAVPGSRVTLEFTRIVELSCATEVVVPSQNIRTTLPLNTPVRVEIRAPQNGEVQFACGMKMHKGAVVVQ